MTQIINTNVMSLNAQHNLSVGSIMSSTIGGIATQVGAAVSSAAATNLTISIAGGAPTSINSSAGYIGPNAGQDATSAYAKARAINAAGIADLEVTAATSGTQAVGAIGGAAGNTYNLTINSVAVFTNTNVATALTNTQLRDGINSVSSQTGVVASLNRGNMTLTANDGRNITVIESGTGFTASTNRLTATGGLFAAVLRGNLTISATNSIAIGGTVTSVGLSAIPMAT